MFENEVYEMDQDFVPKPDKYILHNLVMEPITGQGIYKDVLVQVVMEKLEFQYYKNPEYVHDDYRITITHQWYDGVNDPYIESISCVYEISNRRGLNLITEDKSVFFKFLEDEGLKPFNSQNVFISPVRMFLNEQTPSPEAEEFLVTRVSNYLEGVNLKKTYANILNVLKNLLSTAPTTNVPTTNVKKAFSLASNPPGRMMEFLGRGGKKTNKRYRRKNKSRRRKHKSHRRKH